METIKAILGFLAKALLVIGGIFTGLAVVIVGLALILARIAIPVAIAVMAVVGAVWVFQAVF